MRHLKFLLIVTSFISTALWGHCDCNQNCVRERLIDGINCKGCEIMIDGINCSGCEIMIDGINCSGREIMIDGINCKGCEILIDGINCLGREIMIDGINTACQDFSVRNYVCTNCGWKSSDASSECPECGCTNIQIELSGS